jgi:hypothetical protein
MPPDEIYDALAAMQSAWQGYFQVHLTGGEPFLKFPLLLYANQIAAELNIPCYVETNAGWCVSDDLVTNRLRQLKQAGLDAVLVSCSPFHAVTIPPERTLRAITIAGEIFGHQNVIVYQPEWLDLLIHFGTENPTPLEAYSQTYGVKQAGRFFWQGYGLISGGRSGYKLGHMIERQPPDSFQVDHCRHEILYPHHSHLDLYGNFISGFCGGLTAGDWHSLPHVSTISTVVNIPTLSGYSSQKALLASLTLPVSNMPTNQYLTDMLVSVIYAWMCARTSIQLAAMMNWNLRNSITQYDGSPSPCWIQKFLDLDQITVWIAQETVVNVVLRVDGRRFLDIHLL